MNLKLKINIDKLWGRPSVFALNLLTRLMGYLLNIDHTFSKPPKRIVVCKLLGMGSIIQATPLLQTLKKNFPQSAITFVTSESNRELLTFFPFIDDVICIREKNIFTLISSSFHLISKLWRRKTDLYIDLETYSYFSTIVATLSAARNRLGFYRKESNIRMGLYTHMEYFNNKAPISKAYLQMARVAGCKEIYEELFRFEINEPDRMITERIKINLGEKIVVINPNASDIRVERRWPKENFIQLIETILKQFQEVRIILTGNNSEKDYVSAIFDSISPDCKDRITDTSAQLSLSELIKLINSCDIFITNDTGPMHIAFSLNKTTIALFGPCSPHQYGLAENAVCFYKNVYCSPCVHEFIIPPCHGNNDCMKLIRVDEVMNLFSEVYKGKEATLNTPGIIYSINDKPLGIIKRKKE
jgi:ADP-heptose:LPS heptosyltransferase